MPGVSRAIFAILSTTAWVRSSDARVGQLREHDGVAAILRRQKTARHNFETESGQREQTGVDKQNDDGESGKPRDGVAIGVRAPGEDFVESLEEPAEQAVEQALKQILLRAARPSRRAASAGESVSELSAEIAVETAMVSANWRKNVPVMPVMNAVGMKTEQSTSAIATNAPPTSVMALRAASRGLRPSSMWCSMASTTTMASSTTMPIARTMPKSESC